MIVAGNEAVALFPDNLVFSVIDSIQRFEARVINLAFVSSLLSIFVISLQAARRFSILLQRFYSECSGGIRYFIEGMKPYPLELRERIVSVVDEKIHTIVELADIYQVTERYLYKLLWLRRETEDLTPLPQSGGVEPILKEQRFLLVADLVAHYPDATLQEYRDLIHTHCGVKVCRTTVWSAMEKSAFTRKKNTPRAGSRRGRTCGF